jgi:putative DNA primase/helicase
LKKPLKKKSNLLFSCIIYLKTDTRFRKLLSKFLTTTREEKMMYEDTTQVVQDVTPLVVETQEDDEAVIARLATLSVVEYGRVRKDEAAKMGISVKALDEVVKKAGKATSDSSLPFTTVEPYPQKIDPEKLLNEIFGLCHKFVILDLAQSIAVTLWIVFTWFIEYVQVAPLLIINAPESSCGKTQLLDFVARLSARSMPTSNSSMAYVFRAVELWQPTLLIDEVDTFLKENTEMKGVINAGYIRASAFVGRTVGENHEPKQFKVWGAKALAGIAVDRHLPESTMSRGIIINLRRKMADQKVTLLRHEPANTFDLLASKLARFAQDYAKQVEAARPEFPAELNDRSKDNWEPLLAIAQCGGEGWLERAKEAAVRLAKSTESHVSIGNELLTDIYYIFNGKGIDKISTAELIQALIENDESVWTTFNRGRIVTARNIASQLEKYGIKSRTVRVDKYKTPKGYYAADFQDAFARYLPQDLPAPEQVVTVAEDEDDEY